MALAQNAANCERDSSSVRVSGAERPKLGARTITTNQKKTHPSIFHTRGRRVFDRVSTERRGLCMINVGMDERVLRGGRNVCLCVCVCVRGESFSEITAEPWSWTREKKNHVGRGRRKARGRRGGAGLGVCGLVREEASARSCLGVTDLGITPYVDRTTAISTPLASTHTAYEMNLHDTKERCDQS